MFGVKAHMIQVVEEIARLVWDRSSPGRSTHPSGEVLAMMPRDRLETFYRTSREISNSIHSSTRVEEVLRIVVKKITEVLDAKGALLRILNLKTGELELSAAHGLSERYLSKGPVSSKRAITELCRANTAILIDDVEKDPRIQYPKEVKEEGIRMILDLPLTIEDHVVGILRVSFENPRKFYDEEIDFAIAIAQQSASAIDKARLIEKQQLRYDHLALQTEKLSSLGRMAAGIAHEINNPLAGILLYSTNMLKKVPKESSLKEGLEIIIHETIRCRGIIQELLEFSREREPKKVLANINQVITKALTILENEFRLRRVSVEKQLAEDLPEMHLDVNQMEQVVVNFLMNAIESIQNQGIVSIRSGRDPEGKGVLFEIEDNGAGIPPDQLERIFEPFFSTKPKGTGLGLAVNYGIIEKHGGRISVRSGPSQGTIMQVWLPSDTEVLKGSTGHSHEAHSYSDHR